jgi:hypothetical protein
MSEGFGTIKLVERADISLEKWDALVNKSTHSISMSSWYLDAVMENWSAYVLNDYELAIPIKISKKINFKYSLQALFLRAFTVLGSSSEKTKEFLHKTIETLDFCQINLVSELENELNEFEIKKSQYQFLGFNSDYETISKNYSENTKRKLKDFKKSQAEFTEVTDINLLIDLFKKEKGNQFKHLTTVSYEQLARLMNAAIENDYGIIKAITYENELVAIGFFIKKNSELLYLKGIVNSNGKKIGAMQALFDRIIFENHVSCFGLDFGGSSNVGLASFNKKFGASDRNYIILKRNKLPWPFKIWVNRKLGI